MKLPAALPSPQQKSAEDLFNEACRDANLPPEDPLYIILKEMRGQVATLSMMVQETRDRNHLLETRLAVVLEQARRQDEMRVNRNRSEIERLISRRITSFFMRGSFGKSIGDALLSCLCRDLRAQSLHPRDSPRLVDKLVPCVTADINDIVICFEDYS